MKVKTHPYFIKIAYGLPKIYFTLTLPDEIFLTIACNPAWTSSSRCPLAAMKHISSTVATLQKQHDQLLPFSVRSGTRNQWRLWRSQPLLKVQLLYPYYSYTATTISICFNGRFSCGSALRQTCCKQIRWMLSAINLRPS